MPYTPQGNQHSQTINIGTTTLKITKHLESGGTDGSLDKPIYLINTETNCSQRERTVNGV